MSAKVLFDRALVRVSRRDRDEDAEAFLQGLVTNDVRREAPVYAGLLSAQGKTLFDFLIWREGEDFLIDCEASSAPDLVKRLMLYRLRRAIDIAIDPDRRVLWSPEAFDGAHRDPRHAALGYRAIAPSGDADGKDRRAQAQPGDEEWRAHRLACGVAEGRTELGDILWLETNAEELNGVCFDKGCYIGQENTARMHWRGKVNRRLVVVPLERSDPKRRKYAHEDLDLAIDHRRIEDIPLELAPEWLRPALAAKAEGG